MNNTRRLLLLGIAAILGLPLGAPSGLAATLNEKSKDIIAVQIRKQGFDCNNPENAVRDEAASKPDAEVWTLTCEGVSYRVKLVPDMAADVEKLPDQAPKAQQP